MRWCNKDKKIRRREWATAPAPKGKDINEAMRWCKNQPSSNKFYYHYTNTRWWFEDEKDAILFSLRWL